MFFVVSARLKLKKKKKKHNCPAACPVFDPFFFSTLDESANFSLGMEPFILKYVKMC